MSKTIYNGNYKDHDLTVTVLKSDISASMIANIEEASLAQISMTKAMTDVFSELKAYGFFIPYEPISRPKTGGIRPDGWVLTACYSKMDQLFANIGDDAPAWIMDVASIKDLKMKEDRFAFYSSKWSHLYAEAIETNSYYHLYKLIHDDVTSNGSKPIAGYNAPSPLQVLEAILPEKYKTSKKVSRS